MYGPNDSESMKNMVERMYENGVVEEDYVPWEALVVLMVKNHQ